MSDDRGTTAGALFSDGKKELKAEFERVALPELSHFYTSAFYLTKDKTEAEDLVQETYLRAFRFLENFQPGTNCRAWLLSIQRNLFINRYHQKKRDAERVDWEKIDQVYQSIVEQGENAERDNPEGLLTSGSWMGRWKRLLSACLSSSA